MNKYAVIQEELADGVDSRFTTIHVFQINRYSLDWLSDDRSKWPLAPIQFHEIDHTDQSTGWKKGLVKFIGDNHECQHQIELLERLKLETQTPVESLPEEIMQLRSRLTATEQKIDQLTTANTQLVNTVNLLASELHYLKDKITPTEQLLTTGNARVVGRHRSVVTGADLEAALAIRSDIKGYHHLVSKSVRMDTKNRGWKGLTVAEQEICNDLMEFYLHEKLAKERLFPEKYKPPVDVTSEAIATNSDHNGSDRKRKSRQLIDYGNLGQRITLLRECYQKKLFNDFRKYRKSKNNNQSSASECSSPVINSNNCRPIFHQTYSSYATSDLNALDAAIASLQNGNPGGM